VRMRRCGGRRRADGGDRLSGRSGSMAKDDPKAPSFLGTSPLLLKAPPPVA
jgi:hypothetical protein